jgi:hypothetical protein
MSAKWFKFVHEARIEQVIYEVVFLISYKTDSEQFINFTKIKDEIRSIENVTVVKTDEEKQILSGYEYRDLIIKVALPPPPKVKIKDELLVHIMPKLKEISDIKIVKLTSIERISER